MKNLPLHKSSGIDKLNTRLLKCSSDTIAPIIHYICNLTIDTSTIPRSWKTACVAPIFKEGEEGVPTNYRPVSVIPVPMKILERGAHDQLDKYIIENKLLSQRQSGFHKAHSTITATLDVLDYVYLSTNIGTATGAVYIDLRKAFDTVNHVKLLAKLKNNWDVVIQQ